MMSEAEWKELDTIAFEIESSALAGYYWDLGNEHKPIILAAYRELKERREDEEWMKKHYVDLIYRHDGAVSLHAAGIMGRVIEFTTHAVVTAAREKCWLEPFQ